MLSAPGTKPRLCPSGPTSTPHEAVDVASQSPGPIPPSSPQTAPWVPAGTGTARSASPAEIS